MHFLIPKIQISLLSILLLNVYFSNGLLAQSEECFLDSVFIQSILIDPTGGNFNFDTNGNGQVDSNDEYVEICNASSQNLDISNWSLSDDDPPPSPDYTLPPNTIIESGECLLIVANYCLDEINCALPDHVVDMKLEFSGFLGNSGDVIALSDTLSNVCAVVYGSTDCSSVDPLDIPGFDINNCISWGQDVDGCPLLAVGDSCNYLPQALPVEFLEVKAIPTADQMVQIAWTAIEDAAHDRYFIEWKAQYELPFTTIGWLEANGSQNEVKSYSYMHLSPSKGVNLYRVGQIDFNGRKSYSPTVAANVILSDDVIITPNLVTHQFQVNGDADVYLLDLYSLSGQLIFENSEIRNNEFVDVRSLQKGYYFARVFNGIRTKNFKILKL